MDGAKKSGAGSGVPFELPKLPNLNGGVGNRPGLTPDGKTVSRGDSTTPKSSVSKLTAEAPPARSDVKASASKALAIPDDQRLHKDYIVFRRMALSPFNALSNKAGAIVNVANQLAELVAKSGKPDDIAAQLVILEGSISQMVETFLNADTNEMALSLPKEIERAIRDALIAATDAKRSRNKPEAPEKRAEALERVVAMTSAVKAHVAEALDEQTLQTRYKQQLGLDDLRSILEEPKQCDRLAVLRARCKDDFAEENLDFLLAVQGATKSLEADQPAAYQKLIGDFIAKGSKEVNVSDKLRKRTEAAATLLSQSAADAGALAAVKSQIQACYDEVLSMVLHGAYRAKGGKVSAGG